jgi:hypothetical protein
MTHDEIQQQILALEKKLGDSDEKQAELEEIADLLQHKAKAIKATIFLHNPQNLKTVAEREAYAESCEEYNIAYCAYLSAKRLSDAMEYKRSTAELKIGNRRTFSANRRQG